MFYQYIEIMKLKEKAFLNYTQNLYERAVALYCTDVALWDDYIVFLVSCAYKKVQVNVHDILTITYSWIVPVYLLYWKQSPKEPSVIVHGQVF